MDIFSLKICPDGVYGQFSYSVGTADRRWLFQALYEVLNELLTYFVC